MERVKLTPSLLSSFAVAQAHREHKGRITSIDFDSTGRYCLTSAEDDAMCLYDADVGRFVKLINSKKYGVDLARFLHRSTNVLYASTKNDGTVTRRVIFRLQRPADTEGSPTVAAANGTASIADALRYMSLHDNSYIRYFRGHTARYERGLSTLPSRGSCADLKQTATRLTLRSCRVTSLDINPVNDQVISGGEDQTVRLWDTRSPHCQVRWQFDQRGEG